MSSSGSLREFISQRLTAAAEEIFTEFEKTIVQYEEEIDRQRKMLDITWKPEIKLQRTELQHGFIPDASEVLPGQQLCNQDRNLGLDQKEPDPPQVKEEMMDGQVELKQEIDVIMVTPTSGESSHSEPEPNMDQVQLWNSSVTVKLDQQETKYEQPSLLTCKICGKSFLKRSHLLNHTRTHTGDRPFTCQVCGKSFNRAGTLTTHMRIHTGEKPYSCNICGKSFSQTGHLTNHIRGHTGEKPYSCQICCKRFAQAGNMETHVRRHAGVKPFCCQNCGKSFGQLSALKTHMVKSCKSQLPDNLTWSALGAEPERD
ncbi:zinc finger protein 32-like [Cololabis saira]|uniref:zinc finger protein 32-like n=1 Tax=Cololabis saira TaxID=129043 RepID=UPI002AD1E1FF|nr:zinc finger protein 32-like [Cololabis saira]